MTEDKSSNIFTFPKWTWVLRPGIAIAAVGGLLYAGVLVAVGFSPEATDVGYMPAQPVPYSHALHIGQLGMELGNSGVNIATFNLGRQAPGADAICLVEVDGKVDTAVMKRLEAVSHVKQVKDLRF